MKGFLIAAGIIGALYLADQQYAQGKYASAVGRMVTSDAAFVWSLRATFPTTTSAARSRNWHPAASCRFLSYSQRAVTRSLSCWRKAGSNEPARSSIIGLLREAGLPCEQKCRELMSS